MYSTCLPRSSQPALEGFAKTGARDWGRLLLPGCSGPQLTLPFHDPLPPFPRGMERSPSSISTAPSAGQFYLQSSPWLRPPAGLDAHCLPAASLRALSHQPGHLSPDHCQASQLPATHPQARLTCSLGGSQPVLCCPPVGPAPPAETRPKRRCEP